MVACLAPGSQPPSRDGREEVVRSEKEPQGTTNSRKTLGQTPPNLAQRLENNPSSFPLPEILSEDSHSRYVLEAEVGVSLPEPLNTMMFYSTHPLHEPQGTWYFFIPVVSGTHFHP